MKTRITRRNAFSALFQIFCILVGLAIMFPLIYAFFISFMGAEQIFSITSGLIPERWTTENYVAAFATAPFLRFMFNPP